MREIILASFIAVLGLYIFTTQIPVSITSDKVAAAVSDAISKSEVPIDEEIIEQAVIDSLTILEKAQRMRLTYLFAAYIVIWLVFMLYVLRLERQQHQLDQRLTQLELISNSEE